MNPAVQEFMERLRAKPAEEARKEAKQFLNLLTHAVQKAKEQKTGVPGDFHWVPLPGPQAAALESGAYEVLYGGAAGGGKSDLLLGAARIQSRRGVIFRRTYPQLEDSIIPRSLEIYGDPRRYNRSKHIWFFGGNRHVRFRFLESEANLISYQGAAFDFVGFDELTQFTRLQYEYLFSRCRTTVQGQRCRIISTANPGGEGEEWVRERWAPWLDETHPNPAKSGEVRWFIRYPGAERDTEVPGPDLVFDEASGETLIPKSRTFIAAKLSDNPYLDASPDYRASLQLLPEPLRSQLLKGDWSIGRQDDAYQVIPTAWIKAAMARWTEDGWRDPETGRGRRVDALGVDVARGGQDKTSIVERRGVWFARPDRHPGIATNSGAAVIQILMTHTAAVKSRAALNIDVIGVGASVFDTGKLMGMNVRGVDFRVKAHGRDRSGKFAFVNTRSKAYWKLREDLDPEYGSNLALPPDPQLLGDLRAARWELRPNGILIEDKDKIKERLGRSPDDGDATVLSNYTTDEPAPQQVNVSQFGR
jgi:hypothetical protein